MAWTYPDLSSGVENDVAVAMLFDGELFADYFQVYLHDLNDPTLPHDYTEEAIEQRLTASSNAVIVHTARNMAVPISIEWHDERPAIDLDAFQHVVEAGFAAPSGTIVLGGLTDRTDTAPRLPVAPGPVGVIATFAGLDKLSEDELDGDDRYAVHLWPGAVDAVHVLRQYEVRRTDEG